MRLDIVTLFPELIADFTRYGIVARALERGLVQLTCWNPRDYARDRHRSVDDRPYGGGPGMLMQTEPLCAAIRAARGSGAAVIYLSPQGRRLEQAALNRWAAAPALTLVCGRYEGVDERVIAAEVDAEWSIGDYVLSGGEAAALVVIDALTRLLPGALGDGDSAAQDSFMDGLLDCGHHTRPELFEDRSVPPVLLSGDHQAIRRWRRRDALGRTWARRPELLARRPLSAEDTELLCDYIREQLCGVGD